MAIDISSPRTRRALLTAGFGAVAATVASAVGRVAPVYAAGPVQLDVNNNGAATTSISTDAVAAFEGSSNTGDGLQGVSESGRGVFGSSTSGYGLSGESSSKAGVFGYSDSFAGVLGTSSGGRGGVFRGQKAQVQLHASDAASHPSGGGKGDLFVDKHGRLWFCKGGTSWKRLA